MDGRIAAVQRQEDKHRKFVCMMNDTAKAREVEIQSCLTRERYETSFRYFNNCLNVKQSLVRQKILQKCLTMRRRAANDDPKVQLFGKYGGIPLHGFSRDVEQYLINMHPKVRRIRKVQKLLRESKEDQHAAEKKIESFFSKHNDRLFKVVETTDVSQEGEDTDAEEEKSMIGQKKKRKRTSPNKHIARSSGDEIQTNTNNKNGLRIDTRPALVLPPISSMKALVQH